jgi:hypothetical protein
MSGTAQSSPADFTPPPPAGNGVTDLIDNSTNVGKEFSQFIVSFGLEAALSKGGEKAGKELLGKVLGGAAGALVQPAVWLLSGKPVQPGDPALYLGSTMAGLLGAGPAATVTGVFKAVVEDDEDRAIAAAVASEPAKYRPFISSVRNYGASGRRIVAMEIANHGGVAWRVDRGANWAYITDAKGRLVCDYKPAKAVEIYGPILPLRIVKRTPKEVLFQWEIKPGNSHG